MPRTEFVIEVTDKAGHCDIRRNTKAFAYDVDDVDEALRRIRRKVDKGVEVTVIDADGYRHQEKT